VPPNTVSTGQTSLDSKLSNPENGSATFSEKGKNVLKQSTALEAAVDVLLTPIQEMDPEPAPSMSPSCPSRH
jgi:hypothetical protein